MKCVLAGIVSCSLVIAGGCETGSMTRDVCEDPLEGEEGMMGGGCLRVCVLCRVLA